LLQNDHLAHVTFTSEVVHAGDVLDDLAAGVVVFIVVLLHGGGATI
jgi:hypothetical protein